MDERELGLYNEMAESLEHGLLVSMVTAAIDDLIEMGLVDEDMTYVPARRAYNEVLVPLEAATRHMRVPDEFVAAVGKTEAYLRRFPHLDDLLLDYDIAMDGLQALLLELMPKEVMP